MRKVALIGLDCAAPAVLFDRYRSEMPQLDRWLREAARGPLRSCDPPITVPAWASLFSGRDAGELGIYGFRNRPAWDYSGYRIASARSIDRPCVWDVLAAHDRRSILLGVPPSYPLKPVHGCAVGCFLTPPSAAQTTVPPELAGEIARVAPDYVFDVDGFRGADPEALLARLTAKTRAHFRVARHLLTTRPWEFFAMVEMGTDRLHHAFWRYIDPGHPAWREGTALEDRVRGYFRALDECLGELLDVIGGDAVVMLASDHGAQPMRGGVCINEWLLRNGLLKLRATPGGAGPLLPGQIDWAATTAWSDGGYYARVFLNVRGREPQGRVAAEDCGRVLDDIGAGLAAIEAPDGSRIGAAAHRPDELFRETRGVAPDLIVYFGDLGWRSLGSVGGGAVTACGNDTGADDANHDWDGVFAMRDGSEAWRDTELQGLRLLDVAATILDRAGVAPSLPGVPFGRRNEAGTAAAGGAC
jgi:predicted AlkP superfamily phosphohydrolase/phosphomutase